MSSAALQAAIRGWAKAVRKYKNSVFVDLCSNNSVFSICIPSSVYKASGRIQKGCSLVAYGAPDGCTPFLVQRYSVVGECEANSQGFVQIHAPVLTTNNCEGGSDAFSVTPDHFFGGDKKAHLTVSSQLHLEAAVCSFGKVYSFGPIFRAEKHDSKRHLAEFWMLEVEVAFVESVEQLIALARQLLSAAMSEVKQKYAPELQLIYEQLQSAPKYWQQETVFSQITYNEAVEILQSSNFKIKLGDDLAHEHENYLARENAVFVTNYPEHLKPFYMQQGNDNTCDNFDLLLPDVGEVVGGSLRENNLRRLEARIGKQNLDCNSIQWYLDLRKYGSPPHGGFGIGFDRLLQFVTGVQNIRDVVSFPRSYGAIQA